MDLTINHLISLKLQIGTVLRYLYVTALFPDHICLRVHFGASDVWCRTPGSGTGSGVAGTEAADHLVRADFILIRSLVTFIGFWVGKGLFWTHLLRSRTKSDWVVLLVGFVHLSCKGVYRVESERTSQYSQVFSSLHVDTCACIAGNP